MDFFAISPGGCHLPRTPDGCDCRGVVAGRSCLGVGARDDDGTLSSSSDAGVLARDVVVVVAAPYERPLDDGDPAEDAMDFALPGAALAATWGCHLPRTFPGDLGVLGRVVAAGEIGSSGGVAFRRCCCCRRCGSSSFSSSSSSSCDFVVVGNAVANGRAAAEGAAVVFVALPPGGCHLPRTFPGGGGCVGAAALDCCWIDVMGRDVLAITCD
jgi:hypothetical protein